MNRKELIEKVRFQWDNPNGVEDLTDFILDNFEPKQEERVSAKEVFLAFLKNPSISLKDLDLLVSEVRIAAEAFNNSLNPDSDE